MNLQSSFYSKVDSLAIQLVLLLFFQDKMVFQIYGIRFIYDDYVLSSNQIID